MKFDFLLRPIISYYMPFGQTFEQLALLYRYNKCIDLVSGMIEFICMQWVYSIISNFLRFSPKEDVYLPIQIENIFHVTKICLTVALEIIFESNV